MVVCRCGCNFENFYMDSHVRCPECGRVYPNVASYMYHPKTEEERAWKCEKCGAMNDNSYSGGPRTKCAVCGASRPRGDWYAI